MGPARYIGHLDLSRTLERSFNRARLPIAYTQGFNRRPRMSLAAALPLGFTSEYELADIWLAEKIEPHSAQSKLMRRMAPGIRVNHIAEVPLKLPSLQSSLTSANYDVFLPPAVAKQSDLPQRAAAILAAQSLPHQRKRGRGKIKKYDLRPLIITLGAVAEDDKQPQISMELSLGPSGTGRPDDVLIALSLDPFEARIHRTKISLSQPPVD
jgi:radical SAM-linked protein